MKGSKVSRDEQHGDEGWKSGRIWDVVRHDPVLREV